MNTKLKLSLISRFQETQYVLSDIRVPGYVTGTRVTGIETGTRSDPSTNC